MIRSVRWTAQKALDFILLKKPTVTLKQHFFDQLLHYEDYLRKRIGFNLSKDWGTTSNLSEDLLLTNTYLNTLPKSKRSPRGSFAEKTPEKREVLQWSKKVKVLIPNKYLSLNPNQILSGSEIPEQLKPDNSSVGGTTTRTEKKILKRHTQIERVLTSQQSPNLHNMSETKSANYATVGGLNSSGLSGGDSRPTQSVAGGTSIFSLNTSGGFSGAPTPTSKQFRPSTTAFEMTNNMNLTGGFQSSLSTDNRTMKRNNSLNKEAAKELEMALANPKSFKMSGRMNSLKPRNAATPNNDGSDSERIPGSRNVGVVGRDKVKNEIGREIADVERINHELKMNYGTPGSFNSKLQSGSPNAQISLKRPAPMMGNLIPTAGSAAKSQGLAPTPLNQLIGSDGDNGLGPPQYVESTPQRLQAGFQQMQSQQQQQKRGPIRPKHQILTSKPKQGSGSQTGTNNMFTIRQHSNSVSRPRTVGAAPSERQPGYEVLGTSAKQPSGGSVRVRPSSVMSDLDSVKAKHSSMQDASNSQGFMITGSRKL